MTDLLTRNDIVFRLTELVSVKYDHFSNTQTTSLLCSHNIYNTAKAVPAINSEFLKTITWHEAETVSKRHLPDHKPEASQRPVEEKHGDVCGHFLHLQMISFYTRQGQIDSNYIAICKKLHSRLISGVRRLSEVLIRGKHS